MEEVECVIAGAGAVGLAVARQLALAGREVVVLEAEPGIGAGISARSSEVIHAGIYYPPGSLMARCCIAGRRRLYEYCKEKNIAHAACGKLIVAANADEAERLAGIAARAAQNGVTALRRLSGAEARALEPSLESAGALFSPDTGIIDSHGYMLALRADIEAAGGIIALRAKLEAVSRAGPGFALAIAGAEPCRLRCRVLVNAAGLGAVALAQGIEGLDAALVPRAYLAKGSYFALQAMGGRAPFSRLIYPVPVPGGLGVHLTFDLAGQARFGPDVEWVTQPDYRVEPGRAEGFYAAIRRYWPGLPPSALVPAYAGIRPKITPPGAPAQDFVLQGPQDHGVQGLVNLFGIESPGLTASLALAEEAARLV